VSTHASDSLAQLDAEPVINQAVAAFTETALAPLRIDMEDDVRVEIDGASEDRSILVRAYAHVGTLVGAQPQKLATDAFKLVWAGRKLGSSRLIIAVIAEEVEAYLRRPTAWLTAALRDSQVEIVRVTIDSEARARVTAAHALLVVTGRP
jgi:hypothetical protein